MNRIGIDAGGSLIKIAYEEAGHLHTKTYPIEDIRSCLNWLNMLAPNATLLLTGGKSAHIQSMVKQKNQFIEEFQATIKGTRYLLTKENQRVADPFIQIHIGTGTSIFHVTPDSFERVLGSGIGGGTFMGMGKLISDKVDFQELVALAARGNNQNSDLLIKDIYGSGPSPLLGSLTASNFGKAHLNEDASKADYLASLLRMIGETLLLLATQVATAHQIKSLVFTGGTLTGNQPLQDLIIGFQEFTDFEPTFLVKGAYAGAIGSLLEV